MECIFCKIAGGEIPSEKIMETDNLVVIRDLNPQSPVHLLVIPKRHYKNILECDDTELFGEMISVAKEAAWEEGLAGEDRGFRLVINTNPEGGQTVWHVHMHIMGGRDLSGEMG